MNQKYLADMHCCRLGLLKCAALITCHHLQVLYQSINQLVNQSIQLLAAIQIIVWQLKAGLKHAYN